MEMIWDCEAGKIDFILTKSISRFARNTQDSLKYTRELKEMGIGIYFEKEGLNTLERGCQSPRWKSDMLLRISTPVNVTGIFTARYCVLKSASDTGIEYKQREKT